MMANNNERFKDFVMSISFKERRKRELLKYRKRVHDLKRMDSDEIDFEYISLKSEYEHKKSSLTILIITIALAVLMNVWKYFFAFVEKALYYAASFKGSEIEIAKVSIAISIIVTVVTTFAILIILITYMKEIYRIQKELMIVETVREKRSRD